MSTKLQTIEGKTLSEGDRTQISAVADQITDQSDLPHAVREMVTGMLRHLAAGRDVAVLDPSAYITPADAARIVGVSRPLLNDLLDEGRIPFFETNGGHRKIKAGDVHAYVAARDQFSSDLASARAARRPVGEVIADELGLGADDARTLGLS